MPTRSVIVDSNRQYIIIAGKTVVTARERLSAGSRGSELGRALQFWSCASTYAYEQGDRRTPPNACELDKLRAVMLAAVLAFDDVVPPAPSIGGIIPLLTHLLLEGDGIKDLCFCSAQLLSCCESRHSVWLTFEPAGTRVPDNLHSRREAEKNVIEGRLPPVKNVRIDRLNVYFARTNLSLGSFGGAEKNSLRCERADPTV
jgi:hypothetical protein